MGGPAHGLPIGCGHGLVDGRASGLRMGLPKAEDAGGEIGATEPRHGGKFVELVAADEVFVDHGRCRHGGLHPSGGGRLDPGGPDRGARGRPAFQDLAEVLQAEGLQQKIVHAAGAPGLAGCADDVGGQGNDGHRRDAAGGLFRADPATGLEAVHDGHGAVHEDQVIGAGGDGRHGLETVLDAIGRRAEMGEGRERHLPVHRAVVDHEDPQMAEIGAMLVGSSRRGARSEVFAGDVASDEAAQFAALDRQVETGFTRPVGGFASAAQRTMDTWGRAAQSASLAVKTSAPGPMSRSRPGASARTTP